MLIKRFRYLFEYFKEYGLICLVATLVSSLFPYEENGSSLSWWVLQNKHRVLLKYLTKHYYADYEWKEKSPKTKGAHKECIWTAWLQGEDNAPEVIRLTLASIRKNANDHEVVVLTENTIDNYIDIPCVIKEKHKRGIIGYAHYSDIVRMMILAKYGGIWIDATMLLINSISEEAFKQPFYSVGTKTERTRFVTGSRWIVGVIGGESNSVFIPQISSMLTRYWLEHDLCIDYFVFDYLIAVLYNRNKSFKSIIDVLPKMEYNNKALRDIINEPYQKEKLDRLFIKGQIYYLTYRYDYQKKTIDGKETNYSRLCSMLLV